MEDNKKVGTLLYNYYLGCLDVKFKDGTNLGGLKYRQQFEIHFNRHWIPTYLDFNGCYDYLVGIGGYGVPVGLMVRM